MEMTDVVTAFIVRPADHGVRVLVLRRSDKVGSYHGKWAGVSGHFESAGPLDQALTEIEEEVGLPPDTVRLLASTPPVEIADEDIGRIWRVHSFLFETTAPDSVRLDWEHTELRWVEPQALHRLDTVPGLAPALDALLQRWHARGDRTQTKVGNSQ